jgi:hypothetical protein
MIKRGHDAMKSAQSQPQWTPEALVAKQGLIQARAYQHWRQYKFALDNTFIADLEQEGWRVAFTSTPDDPLLSCKIDDALRAFLRYWLLGLRSIGTTTAPRKIFCQVLMEDNRVKRDLQRRAVMLPEPATILRHAIRLIWRQCTVPMRHVWTAQLMQNSLSLKRKDYRIMKLSESKVSRARKRLQVVAREVLHDGL